MDLFTHAHGRHAGLVKGAFSRNNRSIYLPGNQVEATWNARLAEHLGHLRCELVSPVAALVMRDRARLQTLYYLCELLRLCLPEREPHPRTFEQMALWQSWLLQEILTPAMLHASVVLMELRLLAALGYGLDLSCCAATGMAEGLTYISPKTGRAVSEAAGRPYHDKMLPLPEFVRQGWHDEMGNFAALSPALTEEKVTQGLRLTGYFLDKWVLAPVSRKLPEGRENILRKMVEVI